MMLMLLCTSAWAQEPTMLFHESFGDNPGSARDWNDSYSVKTGVEDVYSGITGYTVGNAKQGKNTTGSTLSGLNQSTQGSDASIVIGPLNVANYESLKLTYQWKAASVKGTYSTTAYYATSANGDYTEVDGTGDGATSFVERAYNLPVEAQVSTLYLKIVFNTSNTQAIIDEVNLDGIETGTAPAVTVAKPVIEFNAENPVEGDNVTCTITCATDGATIQYALNDGEFQAYDEPFTINTTTTVYAKAKLGEDVSEVAQKTITFTPVTTVANIAELTALENGKVFRMTGSATVVYTDASKHIYIKDDTGYTLLYDSHDAADKGYTVSNIVGTVSIYKGLFEAKETDFDVEVGDTQVDPTVMTIPNIAATNMNQYVKLENVSITAPVNQNFTITDAEEHTLQGRDNFSLQDFPNDVTDKKFDIEGFVGIYNGTIQFYPTKFTDVTPAAPFAITVSPEAGTYTEPVTVTITATGLEEGQTAMITYTLNGGNELDYTVPFTLNETTEVHVYATDGTNEATWDGTYTIELPDFSIEPSVASGTTLYKATDVTFTPKNGFGDLAISYKVNDSDEEITDAAFTVNVAENTTVTIEAVDGAGREFKGDFTYTVDLFVPAKKFKLVTDLTELEAGKQVLIAGVNNDMYVMGGQNDNNRAAVKCGLGTDLTAPLSTLDFTNANVTYQTMVLGQDGDYYTFFDVYKEGYLYAASSTKNYLRTESQLDNNGKAAITTLEDGTFSVVFQGDNENKYMQFNSSNTLFSCYGSASQKPVYLYVVEKTATPEIVVTEGEEAYTVTATGAGTVKLYKDGEEVENPCTVARTSEEQTFVFTATAKEEGKDISKVATQNVTVPALPATTYTITLDKEPGDYTELVNVKATVEPALPEGATLTFKINDAEQPKEYNPEKGVNMLESGTLTFTATDAAGNVLATKSAEYKYIMRVFGDLNGDGKVDVDEVGTVVNLILGKLNN